MTFKRFFSLILVFSAITCFADQKIDTFTVKETTGKGPAKQYIKGGFPLAEGKFKDVKNLCVENEKGEPVYCNITVLNTWLDNSVKWALLEFVDDFKPNEKKKYNLVQKDNVPDMEVQAANTFNLEDMVKNSTIIISVDGAMLEENEVYYSKSEDNKFKSSGILHADLISKADPKKFFKVEISFDAIKQLDLVKIGFSATNYGLDDYVKLDRLALNINGRVNHGKIMPKVFTDDKEGWLALSSSENTFVIACEDLANKQPKKLDYNNAFIYGLYASSTSQKIKQGIQLNEYMSLAKLPGIPSAGEIKQAAAAVTNTLFPVFTPAYYCGTGALGPITPADGEKFPNYEKIVESNWNYVQKQMEDSKDYGIIDYGDYCRDRKKNHWGNQHYDIQYCMFVQFARTGDLKFLNKGIAAARHMIGVDTCHFDKIPWFIGRTYTEQVGHYEQGGGYMGFAKNHGSYQYYNFTGDKKGLEAGNLTADYVAHEAYKEQYYKFGEERIAGYGLMALVQGYEATRAPAYLEHAKHVVDVLYEWQDSKTGAWFVKPDAAGAPRPVSDTNGCVFMLGSIHEGLIDYYNITKDERAKQMVIKNSEYITDVLWAPEPEKYDITLLTIYGLAWSYKLTGEEKLIKKAIVAYEFAVQNGEWASAKQMAQHMRSTPQFLGIIANDEKLYKMSTKW